MTGASLNQVYHIGQKYLKYNLSTTVINLYTSSNENVSKNQSVILWKPSPNKFISYPKRYERPNFMIANISDLMIIDTYAWKQEEKQIFVHAWVEGVRIAEIKVKASKSASPCFNGKTRSWLLFNVQCTCNILNSLTCSKPDL